MRKTTSTLFVIIGMCFGTCLQAECLKGGKDLKIVTEKECKAAGGKFMDDDFCLKHNKRIPAKNKKACDAAGGKWIDQDGNDQE